MKILFLCVANSARSQIAEGLAKAMMKGTAEIQSAGSAPSGTVNSWAIEVLKEKGVDITQNYSKSVEALPQNFIASLDFVITLCSEEVCPAIVTKGMCLHWPISDPALLRESEKAAGFRSVRDLSEQKLIEFQNTYLS